MTVTTKFSLEQCVKHKLNEYEGFITGIVLRGNGVEYEVLQLTGQDGSWRDSKWISEKFLVEVK